MLSNGENVLAEIPLEHMVMYEGYGRIGDILTLTPQCVCCLKVVAHMLALKEKGCKNNVRFALYTEDYVELTIDHITPKFEGGRNHISNYQVLCLFCNRSKGSANITIEELREIIKLRLRNVL